MLPSNHLHPEPLLPQYMLRAADSIAKSALCFTSQPQAPVTPPRNRPSSAPALAASPLSKTASMGSEDIAGCAMVRAGSTLWAAEGASKQAAVAAEDAVGRGAERAAEAVGTAAGQVASAADQVLQGVRAAAGQVGEGAAESATDSVRQVMEAGKEAAQAVVSEAMQAAHTAEDAAAAAISEAAEVVSGVRQTAAGAAAKAAEDVKQASTEVRTWCACVAGHRYVVNHYTRRCCMHINRTESCCPRSATSSAARAN